ncbi:MAG: hypothetical protein KC621_10495 [Myxococcales bacterium]|nr:hypothetical protein [Myxococcales bacterium]
MTCGNCGSALSQRESGGKPHPWCPSCRTFWNSEKQLTRVHAHRREPPPGSVVSLVYEPNRTSHDDLVVRVGTWAARSDTYYYTLDPRAGKDGDPVGAIRALLKGWRAAVEACADGEVAWLPHDFSDQYTSWLRCPRDGDAFQIVDGTTGLEGYTFYPSDFGEAAGRLTDFTPCLYFGEPLRVARRQLLDDIGASLVHLASARS